MIRYREVPRAFVQVVYVEGVFGPQMPLADAHIAESELFIGVFAPRLLGVFGAKPMSDGRAYVWFSETPALAEHRVGFLRTVGQVVGMFQAHYPRLFGLCVEPRSARWLNWIGAEFTDSMSFNFGAR